MICKTCTGMVFAYTVRCSDSNQLQDLKIKQQYLQFRLLRFFTEQSIIAKTIQRLMFTEKPASRMQILYSTLPHPSPPLPIIHSVRTVIM
jgi:hypothetical protein